MRFTIVTVCMNAERTIGDTIKSVAAQTYADYEHLIIDGLSKDKTLEIVAAAGNPKLRVLSERDAGLYDAMNKGLALAAGEYILFLNADDTLSRPDALQKISERIDQTGADCIFASTRFVEADGSTPTRRLYSTAGFQRWWLRIGVMPPHPSAFVRRTALIAARGFDTGYRIAADFDLLAKVLLRDRASFATLPMTTTHFRVGGLTTSGMRTNVAVGKEFAASLRALGQPLATLAVQLRYPFKLAQFLYRDR